MKKYYKQGSSIFKFDFETETMTCVTENIFNKGIVISDGMSGPFQSMASSFSSSISNNNDIRMGEPTTETTEEEFAAAFKYAHDSITSASLAL